MAAEAQDLSILCLSDDDDLVQSWSHYFARKGQEMTVHSPEDLGEAKSMLQKHAVAFAVTSIADPSSGSASLSARFSVNSIKFPPLVVVLGKEANPEELEALREMGVSHVIVGEIGDTDLPEVEAISRSSSWFTADVHSAPLPDVLQMMERNGRSVMVSVARSAEKAVTDQPWKQRKGRGWQGRLYLKEGQLIRAETPNAEGVQALAQMLSLRDGTIRVHDIYLEPLTPNTSGSIQNALLDATVAMDEMDKDGSGGVPRPTYDDEDDSAEAVDDDLVFDVSDADMVDEGSDDMSGLKGLLAIAPNLQGAAKADKSGSVVQLEGEIQAETACAVAAIGTQQLEGAAAVLGLGDIRGWSVVTQNIAMYVTNQAEGMTVVVGGAARNAEVNLQKITAKLAK